MATCQISCCISLWSFEQYIAKNGFIDVIALPQTFGVATIYSASKTNTEKYSAQKIVVLLLLFIR
jgi:hypothetical protein